ncbi:MAG: hypothetical protein ACYCZX_00100 [Rhodospirillaceae bacterium]
MAQTERQAQEARRVFAKSAARIEQRDTGYLLERRRIQKANDEKTARLKALRLGKEAADRIVAEAAAAEKAAQPKRAKKAKAVAATTESPAEPPADA